MKNIVTLIDFTDTATIALKQSIALAKMHSATISLCNVVSTEVAIKEAEGKLAASAKLVQVAGLQSEIVVLVGDLFREVPLWVKQMSPDLVVVGTHGKKGLVQNLFGSNIFKLVRQISGSTLVVNDYSPVVEGGFKKVLFPVAPHFNYQIKAEQTLAVLAPEAKLLLFEIKKPGVDYDEQIWENLVQTKSYLSANKIDWDFVAKGSDSFSIGYSRETLAFAQSDEIDLLSIMTEVSESGKSYGKIDKENVLLNQQGLAVLCTNSY